MRASGTLALLLILSLLPFLGGCPSPPVAGLGEEVEQRDVRVMVTSTDLAYVDLEGPTGAQQTQDPLLKIYLQVTNQSERAVRYDLGWNSTSVTQASSALLFTGEGEDTLPPPSANIINPVFLGQHAYLDDPVTEAVTIAPGATLEDVILFQRPPSGTTSLVLSLPPRIFGSDAQMPAYVRIPWSDPGDIQRPEPIGIGDTWERGGVSFALNSARIEYVPLVRGRDAAGFSAEPLFRIDYEVTNSTERTVTFMSNRSTSVDPPRLLSEDGTAVSRATFESDINVPDQVTRNTQLGSGQSQADFLLFDRPAEGTEVVTLLIPARRFGGNGLIRASIPFEWSEPELPEELRTDDDDDD